MPMAGAESFLYFAYGSNLSSKRINKNVPSAVFVCTARLPGYVLRYCEYSDSWKGAAATIWEKEGEEAWGVVWRISNQDSDALDRQEARYNRLKVEVTTPQGEVMKCRSYRLRHPDPQDGPPSPQYLETVLAGAKENHLPEDYVRRQLHVQHNGYQGKVVVP